MTENGEEMEKLGNRRDFSFSSVYLVGFGKVEKIEWEDRKDNLYKFILMLNNFLYSSNNYLILIKINKITFYKNLYIINIISYYFYLLLYYIIYFV